MNNSPAKKKWQTPTMEVISARHVKGGGPNASTEVSVTGGGRYYIHLSPKGIPIQVVQGSYTQAHS